MNVEKLVADFQAARARGKPVTIDDLCRDHPELRPAVAKRLAQLGAGYAETVAYQSLDTAPSGASPSSSEASYPQTLGGYRIEKILGQGGMGAVYLAHDDRLGRAAAIKTMKAEIANHPGAKERFLREARAAAQVAHDNIIPIWQVGEEAGIAFIAMPLLLGESLADRLERERVQPLGTLLKIGREVAEGLAAAHAHGLIHRDIKPANVWLEGDPKNSDPAARLKRCKILDFGLARPETDDTHLTATGVVVGTPAYMSPEQASGKPVDHRTDLFSLGVMMYRMATGVLPFGGGSIMSILSNLATVDPPSPSSKNPAVPAIVSDVILKLLAKDPAQRPASARVVADNLREITKQLVAAKKGGPLPAAPAPQTVAVRQAVETANPFTGIAAQATVVRPAEPVHTPNKRNRNLILLSACGAVALIAVVIIATRGTGDRTKKATEPPLQELVAKKETKVIVPTEQPNAPAPEPAVTGPIPRGSLVTTPTPIKPIAPAVERRAAEWAVSIGGKVQVTLGGGTIYVTTVKDLPATPFAVLRMLLTGCGKKVTSSGLTCLKGLARITHFYAMDTAIADQDLELLKDLDTLVDIRLSKTAISDNGLEKLKGLKNLQNLGVYSTRVTDSGLKHIEGLVNLYELDLSNTAVTGAGFAGLKNFTNLALLSLGTAKTADSSLGNLKNFPNLDSLDLINTPITDAGLAYLKGSTIRRLILMNTKATDAGLEHLKALPQLEHLHLAGPKLTTDLGMSKLKSLPRLTLLVLGGSPSLTDAGVAHLKALPRLSELQIARAAEPVLVEKLRKGLPKCQVVVVP